MQKSKTEKVVAILLGILDIGCFIGVVLLFLPVFIHSEEPVLSTQEQETLPVQTEGMIKKSNDELKFVHNQPQTQPSQSVAETTGPADQGDYIFENSNREFLNEEALEGLSAWQLKLARNEIYARHGRMFQDQQLADYFLEKSWYTPLYTPEQFEAMGQSMLNEYEIANLRLIKGKEEQQQ